MVIFSRRITRQIHLRRTAIQIACQIKTKRIHDDSVFQASGIVEIALFDRNVSDSLDHLPL